MSTTTDETGSSIGLPRSLTAAVDFAVASHRRAIALLVVFSFLVFLPGFFQIPPVDRDEARFAQATKQMLESKDFVDIRFQNEVRYKKPVGIYWLQAAAVKAGETLGVPQARTTIWLYRLPSLFGAIGAVLLTYWAALVFVPRRAALFAALMMASSVLLGIEARIAKTDAMLLLTSVAAMGALARIYLASQTEPQDDKGDWRQPAILWTTIAAGVLLKGPRSRCSLDLRLSCFPSSTNLPAGSGRYDLLPALSGSFCWCRHGSWRSLQSPAPVSSCRRSVMTCSTRSRAGRRLIARRQGSIFCCSGSRSGLAPC